MNPILYKAESCLIFVLTFFATSMIYLPQPYSTIAPFLGLLCQPLWLHRTWVTKQWSFFGLSCWFTLTWAYGCYVKIGG